jgi:hypothetical protein
MTDNLPSAPNQVTGLAVQYPILNPLENAEIQKIAKENLGPRGLAERDLERIKAPSGGATIFTINGIDGEEHLKELNGLILAFRDGRMYYRVPYAERGKKAGPPDCLSKDGYTGVGDPGGVCADCPLAGWGSDPKGGRGQACKQIRQLLILRADNFLPDLVNVPPTSLRNAEQYFRRLFSRRIPHWGLVTNLKLERVSNADGVDYARMVFSAGPRLSEAERRILEPYQQQMVQLLHNTAIEATDYDVAGDDIVAAPRGSGYAPLTDD